MVGSVLFDWLVREWIRGIRGDKDPPSNSHHLFYRFTMSGLFQTNNSNLPSSFLYPRVTGTKTQTAYDLSNAIGTITQINKCVFDKAYNGQGPSGYSFKPLAMRDSWNTVISIDGNLFLHIICAAQTVSCANRSRNFSSR